MTGILGVVRLVATLRGSSTVCPIYEVAADDGKCTLPVLIVVVFNGTSVLLVPAAAGTVDDKSAGPSRLSGGSVLG